MPERDEFETIRLGAAAGVEARWYSARGARCAAILLGGPGGGFDSPANEIYVRLGRHLPSDSIAVLRVRFRHPGDLEACGSDVLTAIDWLVARAIPRVGLVGHSFGGAVAITAAAVRRAAVRAVVTLATQSSGTQGAARLGGLPVLLIHGSDDTVLPPTCSVQVFQHAGPAAQLQLVPGAGHVLDEAADEVYRLTHGWLVQHLDATAAGGH